MSQEKDSLQESVYDAFLTAYMKKHPELTREQAALKLRAEFIESAT
jgi:hypothetical protein